MEELINENEENVYLDSRLSELRKSKQDGTLDLDKYFAQQTIKWRNILKYNVLEMYVGHYNKEYRLNTLALLVESKKSTLRFTSKELDIILLFLKCNLCEKIEYVPFIQKALKRFRDSLAVMRRQWTQKIKMKNHSKKQDTVSETCRETSTIPDETEQIENNIKDYTMFFINLRKICVNNLYPDATYRRRCSSLQILLLAQELLCNEFKDIEWREKQVQIIFQCLLLDTYEPNKEMAYQLLKHTNPILLHLDSKKRVTEILTVAFTLGSSMRPIDSITAAYIFKITLLSPIIKDVLNNDVFQSFIPWSKSCPNYKVNDNIIDARTLQIIFILYRKLNEAFIHSLSNTKKKTKIGMVFAKCSVYGYLFCMRSLLSDCDLRGAGKDGLWQVIVNDIIKLCIKLIEAVSVIVNNSSPEGHLPMDLKTLSYDTPFSKIMTSQMVLLCSWRTVKEISHLFGLFATKASIQITTFKDELLSKLQIAHMMAHFYVLLCETKHRGAFEQAYVGFHQLCTRLWQLTIPDLKLLPVQYLHDTLISTTGLTPGLTPGYLKLCATRRSAGVPFLIQGLLSSALETDNNSSRYFCSVMKILLQFTKLEDTVDLSAKVKSIMYEDTVFSDYKNKLMEPEIYSKNEHHNGEVEPDITEIKVHSMNILRALFRNSQLSDMVKDYITDGLIVAFKHYDGRTWAERNAATLLFSAIIVRTFGVQRTKDQINLTTCNMMTGKLFFERFPNLLPFILDELQAFVSTNDTMIKSNVQAILLLLSRLYISHFHETNATWKAEELRNLVLQCAKSPVYQTRELAARALIPLLTEDTAHSTLTHLFQLVLETTQDIRVLRTSANLVHGYLLQILKILRKFPSVKKSLKPYPVEDFLNILQCILNCLNRRSDGFNSFPLATVYVDILHELYKEEKDIIDDCRMKDILHTLQQWIYQIFYQIILIGEDLSEQPWPGEQMYKISVIKFVLCVGKYSNFLQTIHNGQSKAFEIWSSLLITPEVEVQSIAWSTISEVLTREQESDQRKLLGDYAVLEAINVTKDLHKYNPDMQDALFDFLYNCLINADEWFVIDADYKRHEICTLVLRKMNSHEINNVYFQRVNYLRLLGKCMATLIHNITDEKLKIEYKENVYRKVCNSNWISSLCQDLRPSVFDILFDLFHINDIDANQCHPVLDWWTMTLQLLVDDNIDVRCEACKLICRIEQSNELECLERMLPVFFQIFNNTVANKYPEVAISALFCWSVSLMGDADYKMDDTDIFNKCRNYDVFEPVRISKMCYDLILSIMQRYSIDDILPLDLVKWINYHLDTDFAALSFREIVRHYMRNVPKVKKELSEISDPMFKNKLLQALACEKYKTL